MIEADYLMENNIFLHKSFGLTIQMAIFYSLPIMLKGIIRGTGVILYQV